MEVVWRRASQQQSLCQQISDSRATPLGSTAPPWLVATKVAVSSTVVMVMPTNKPLAVAGERSVRVLDSPNSIFSRLSNGFGEYLLSMSSVSTNRKKSWPIAVRPNGYLDTSRFWNASRAVV